jgi:hypothetical protein
MRALLILLGLLFLASPVSAQDTFYINPSTGNDTTGDGSQGTPWRTVKGALAKANCCANDTVHLAAGDYRENDVTTIESNVTWVCDGPVRWLGTRAQPGGGWGWVNHSGNAYKILNFNATYSFAPTYVVEEDFAHWEPLLVDEDAGGNSVLYYHELPMKSVSTAIVDGTGATGITPVIRYPGTHYYDSVNDVLYYHSYQSEDPTTLTIGIQAAEDGTWRLGPGNILNPVGTPGYLLVLWAYRSIRADGPGTVTLRQGFQLQSNSIQCSGSPTLVLSDWRIEGAGYPGDVREADVTSITRSGSTATVTQTPSDNTFVGMYKWISGADQAEYNGYHKVISVGGAGTWSFTVAGTPATPATGTIDTTHLEHMNYASGPSPSPASFSFGSCGSSSTMDRVTMSRSFNAITAATGVTVTDTVAWSHPNHGHSGDVTATFKRIYVGVGQDSFNIGNSANYTITDSVLGDGVPNSSATSTSTHRRNVMQSGAQLAIAGAAADSDSNILLANWDGTDNATPGVSGTVWSTASGGAYEGAGPGSDVCTAVTQECASRRLQSYAWVDGSLFAHARDPRLMPTRFDFVPAPGSILVGMKVGFWERFHTAAPKRPFPNAADLQVARPLAGW